MKQKIQVRVIDILMLGILCKNEEQLFLNILFVFVVMEKLFAVKFIIYSREYNM